MKSSIVTKLLVGRPRGRALIRKRLRDQRQQHRRADETNKGRRAHAREVRNENGQPTELIGTHDTHACAGCNSKLTVTGHAKGDITELKHSCQACGDDSAFCCAAKTGSGPTPGMAK